MGSFIHVDEIPPDELDPSSGLRFRVTGNLDPDTVDVLLRPMLDRLILDHADAVTAALARHLMSGVGGAVGQIGGIFKRRPGRE